ncbi:unnamed protein product [Rhizoctonia solani]|uniref:Uncharacterized protein n=1 Tax=Rhizoctonia solani TaxID=456999 RepID=A0A8H3E4E2_9AGAM|nr:unnamed protein product [Rhizoctonia solani]
MTSPMNSNAMDAPAPVQKNLCRRPIRAATELVAKSAANLIDIPGLKDSVRAARGIVGALRANILQEPARNDLVTQNLIDYLNETLISCAQDEAEIVEDSEYLEDLRRIKAAVIELKNKTYGTKLACQQDIGRELIKRREEITERALLFSVEGSLCGRRADVRSIELEQRFERILESFTIHQGELTSVRLQLARQDRQLQLHRCATFGNSVDLNIKVFFFKHEGGHVACIRSRGLFY